MRAPRVTAVAFRRLTTVNLVLLVAIIVSGAIVRLTNSGLGCRDWPNCNAQQFVSVATHHAAIEQVNRIFSGAIGVPLGLTVLAAYHLRPRRGDLVRLAWALFALFWCEAILGGISVTVKLAWVSVMGHFLLALALVSIALRMRQRAREAQGLRAAVVPPPARLLVRGVYMLSIGVVVLGTLVTAAGPHGGDRDARRLSVPIADLARYLAQTRQHLSKSLHQYPDLIRSPLRRQLHGQIPGGDLPGSVGDFANRIRDRDMQPR